MTLYSVPRPRWVRQTHADVWFNLLIIVSGNVRCQSKAHYSDVIMGAMAFQITSLTIVYSIVSSGVDQRKHQSSTVTGLCAGNSPMTGEFPAQMACNAEMFPFGDVIMAPSDALRSIRSFRTSCFWYLYQTIKLLINKNGFGNFICECSNVISFLNL